MNEFPENICAPKGNPLRFLCGMFLSVLVLWLGAACGREGTARPETGRETVVPVAVAGPDQIVMVGRETLQDGRNSTNPAEVPDFSYRWSLLDRPYFSGAFLLDWDQPVTSFIPDLPGRYYLELMVSDGKSDSSDLAIITAREPRPGNRAPEIVGFTPSAELIFLNPGPVLEFSAAAEDPDGDEMVYNWYVDGIFTVSGSDFSFTAGPEQAGKTMAVRVEVSDGEMTASRDWVVTVSASGDGENLPPVFTPVPDQAVREGDTLVFTVRAEDPDQDVVSYLASLLPAGAVFYRETGKFKWTPEYDQAGDYRVVFSASDGSAVGSLTVEIRVLNTNRAPALEVEGGLTVFEGGELVLRLVGSDPDEDLLGFDYNPLLAGAALYPQGSTAEWVWSPGYDQAGSYREIFSVTDLSDPPRTASVTLDLVVYNTNRPPVLAGLTDRVTGEGQALDFWWNATDPDGDGVTYAAGPLPRGSNLNVNTGEFFWLPDFDQAGDYPVTVTATDSGDPRLADTGTILVTVLNVNLPPAITAFTAAPNPLKTGETISFSVTAHDPDGDATLAGYDWDFDGNGSWDLHTAAAAADHAYPLNGSYTARVRVSDADGLTAEATTAVSVKPAVSSLLQTRAMKSGSAKGIHLEVAAGSPPSGYVYLADGEAGMEIFSVPDLGDPEPVLWSRSSSSGDARNVAVYKNHAYLSLSDMYPGQTQAGVKVFAAASPSLPIYEGTVAGSEPIVDTWLSTHPVTGADFAYLLKADAMTVGMFIYDLADLSGPYKSIYNDKWGTLRGRAVRQDDRGYVYAADSMNKLYIYNFTTPSLAGSYFDSVTSLATSARDLCLPEYGGKQYLFLGRIGNASGYNGTVAAYDVDKYPLGPVLSGSIPTKNCGDTTCNPEGIFAAGGPDLVYVAIGPWGYQIIDAGDPANLSMVIPGGGQDERFDPCPGCDYTYDLAAYGDYTYLADGAMGLVVTKNNLSTTKIPSLVSFRHPSGNPTDLQVRNGRLFLSLGRGGLDVYDLSSNPESPGLVGNVDTPGEAKGLDSDGIRWAYVADRDTSSGVPPGTDRDGLRIIDFATDPVRPVVTASWTDPLLSSVARVFESGNYAYLCADKLYIINVENPTAPAKAGDYSISSPRDIVTSGNYAYVINQNTFEVINISNPALPIRRYLNTTDIINGQAIAYANGLVYVADGDSGLKIYDVSDPQNITARGSYSGKAYDVDLAGEYAFIAGDDSGMLMLDVSDPANPVLQASQAVASRVVNRLSVYYDAGSHVYYVYTLNGTWILGTLTLDQLSVTRIR